MSTDAKPAAPAPAAASSGYSLARPHGKCSVCNRDIPVGEKFTAAVRETAAGLERIEVDAPCWNTFDRAALLAFWQASISTAVAPKPKLFVDDSVLCDLFERLAESGDEPDKVNFRFVLGLILMRKRLLVYESSRVEGSKEFWNVRVKGKEGLIPLLNPRLDEQQVTQVSAQLSQILSGESA